MLITRTNTLFKCAGCDKDKRLAELTDVCVTQKTGEVCYGRRDVHPTGSVTGRVETKKYQFDKTVRVVRKLCADCLWTANQAARRSNGNIVIREL